MFDVTLDSCFRFWILRDAALLNHDSVAYDSEEQVF